MKKCFLIIFGGFTWFNSIGQLESSAFAGQRTFWARDLSGQSLFKKYDGDISGAPFLSDSWMLANLTLSKGKVIGPVSVKLNIESNELYYLDSLGREMIAAKGIVRKINYLNSFSKDSIKYVFKNGFPKFNEQDTNFFYQLYTEGKMELLGKKAKYIRVTKNELSGETTKEFLDAATVLYVYTNMTMQEFFPYKSFIINLMRDKEAAVTKYMSEQKINLKKTADIIKLFNYYMIL